MELTKEYLAEQEDCIKRNFEGYKRNLKDYATLLRLETLKNFCSNSGSVLSVGSAGVEPGFIGATHALDVHPVAETLLRENGWLGSFTLGSCDELPFPDNSFDVAVCSEVIEHLPDLEIVKKTFQELNRVARRWIVTTPQIDVHEPTHKRVFTEEDLKVLASGLNVKIYKKGIFFYVEKN